MHFRLLTLAIVLSLPQLAKAQGEWVEVPSTHPWKLLDLTSSSEGHLAGFVGSFFAVWSTDEGNSWSVGSQYFPYSVLTFVEMAEMHYFSPAHGVAMMNHSYFEPHHADRLTGRIAITKDSGRTWHGAYSGGGWDEINWPSRVQFGDGGLVMLPNLSGAYFSDGVTSGTIGFPGVPPGYLTYGLAMSDLKNIAMVRSETFRSVDSGKTFDESSNFLAGTDSLIRLWSIGLLPSGTRIAAGSDQLYRNAEGGDQWRAIIPVAGPLQFTHRFGTTFAQYRKDYIYTESLGKTLFESTDDGLTWDSTQFEGDVRSVVPVSGTLTYLLAGNKIYKRESPATVSALKSEAASLILKNPVNDQLILRSAADNLTITDITGRTVLRASSIDRVDVSSLPRGVYQLILTSREGTRACKFVIER